MVVDKASKLLATRSPPRPLISLDVKHNWIYNDDTSIIIEAIHVEKKEKKDVIRICNI